MSGAVVAAGARSDAAAIAAEAVIANGAGAKTSAVGVATARGAAVGNAADSDDEDRGLRFEDSAGDGDHRPVSAAVSDEEASAAGGHDRGRGLRKCR